MSIVHAHSFLVHPGKNEQAQPEIGGATIPRKNRVFAMLSQIYKDADKECDIDIVFRHSADGRQQNDCRELLLAYVRQPNVANGRAIAARLQKITTHRSGLGLLFLVVGSETTKKLMIARFPADQGVVAQQGGTHLQVEFIERVFMQSARSYKNVIYGGPVGAGGFWRGRAVDKQMNERRELANYWIVDFLDSELTTTGPAGTKRLAVALRDAIRGANDPDVRGDLLSSARLMRQRHGQTITVRRLCEALGLTPQTLDFLASKLPRRELVDDQFRFDVEEFDKHVMYRSLELDNGATLIAEDARFDDVFHKEARVAGRAVTFSTTGTVVKEQLRKTV